MFSAITGAQRIPSASVDFDGTNDVMKRGAGLSGASDGKLFTFSCWFRLDGGDGVEQSLLAGARSSGSATTDFEIFRGSDNKLSLAANSPGGAATILFVSTPATYTSGATWHHLLASIDMANVGGSFIFVDDVDSGASPLVFTNSNIDFTLADWIIGGLGDSSLKFNGCLAEFWFNFSWLDLSTVSNRRKWRTAAGKPAFLGLNGALPTGSAPAIYQRIRKGELATTFVTNRGGGGGFTLTGTLDIGSTSPS
jgi:hypothetical protein